MFRRNSVIPLAVVLLLLAQPAAFAITYSGSLQYTPSYPPDSEDGLFVGPSDLQWVNYTVGISWTVTDEDASYGGFPWKYSYTFGHDGSQAGISHIIIEGSMGISAGDLIGLTGATIDSVGLQSANSGTPNMPEDLYGIRFNPLTESPFGMTWTFWSNRAPVWGDFYSRCGGKLGGINYTYNYNLTGGVEMGFLVNDVDPDAPPSSGSSNYHILRPDSVVPEPSSMIALFGGMAAMGGMVRLRRKQ